MNKRTVVEIFPQSVINLWDEWHLRGLVLVSLFLQIVLALLGNRRKYRPGNLLRFILWLAYSPADWIASVSIGVLLNCQGDGEDSPSQQIGAFWAPFLLQHLGGPDTITAYSLEDNELWKRHLLGLIMQSGGALYVFLRSWKGTPLNILAIPMFLAGLIKYVERTWFLKSRSNNRFRKYLTPPPDPGPSYVEFVEKYDLNRVQGHYVSLQPKEISKKDMPSPAPINKSIPDASLLLEVKNFFPQLKLLFTDFVLESEDLDGSRSFFKDTSWTEAFRVIEIELGFVYDMLYTKAMVAYHKGGALLRFFCLFVIISTFIAFLVIDRHEYSTIDVIITLLLLVAAILLEIYSIILLFSSDWTLSWLSNQEKTPMNLTCQAISNCRVPILFPANKRWSNSMAQHNLISYSLKNFPMKFSEVWKFFCIHQMLEERSSRNSKVVPKYLKSLIFDQLKMKSPSALSIKKAKEVCAQRGQCTLEKMNCWPTLGWSIGDEFDRSILLWHLATDLCYYTDLNKNPSPVKNSSCKASKLLSDYMVYLLVKQPLMLPDGIGQIRFQDSCAEATEVFRRGKHAKDRVQACLKLLLVNTEIYPLDVKGGKSKSVLFDACRLAKSLQSLETKEGWVREDKWKMISHVWVEMLCYAACQCRWNHHAKELRRGGELLTHVWLLMAHFGITEHFRDSQGHHMVVLVVN